MINVYICELDPLMLLSIKKMLKKVATDYELDISTKAFVSEEELLTEYEKDKELINLICLDTVVERKSGIGIAKQLRKTGYEGEIIFFSDDETEVLNSFEVRAMAYFVRGRKLYSNFCTAFLKLAKKIVWRPEQCLICSQIGMVKRIPVKDIKYIEIIGRTSKVYYKAEVANIGRGLTSLEEQLSDKSFVRVSRFLLVNVNYITNRNNKYIQLLDGQEISIGATYLKRVSEKISGPFWEPCHIAF